MTLLLGKHVLAAAFLDALRAHAAPISVDAGVPVRGRTGEWVKSQRALALAAATGPARLDQPKRDSKGPQAPLKKQGTRSAKDDDIAKMAIDDRPLAKSLSKKTSRLEVVKVHHSPRAPPQAERCGVLCCLTVSHFRVLLVTRCMCGGNR